MNAVSSSGAAFNNVDFQLQGSVVSDPVGPIGTDPTTSIPIYTTLDASLTYTAPLVISPPLVDTTTTIDPFVYLPPPPPVTPVLTPTYQDWYWFYGFTYSYSIP